MSTDTETAADDLVHIYERIAVYDVRTGKNIFPNVDDWFIDEEGLNILRDYPDDRREVVAIFQEWSYVTMEPNPEWGPAEQPKDT